MAIRSIPLPRRVWQASLAFFYWPVRTILRLTREGLLFGSLIVACAAVAARAEGQSNVPLLISLSLFALWIGALVLGTWSLRKLKVERQVPERTFAGAPTTVTVTVRNSSRLPAGGLLLSENLRPAVLAGGSAKPMESQRIMLAGTAARPTAESSGQTFMLAVPPQGAERARYTLRVRRRGIYFFGRTQLSTTFPFGLWRSSLEQRTPGRLAVYPRLGEIDTSLFQEMERALERIRRSRPSREEIDFRGLREYRHGDNPKWIHWRSSARQGKTFVKEFEEPQTKRVLLLLDTNLQKLGGQRGPAFELALSFAGSAARELMRRGYEAECLALPPGQRASRTLLSRERRNLETFLETLAGLQPDNTRTLADLRGAVQRQRLQNAYVLVLGLGSLRMRADLTWLKGLDNYVKLIDVRGDEFRRLFRRTPIPGTREDDEDLLLNLGEEELEELAQEELALVG